MSEIQVFIDEAKEKGFSVYIPEKLTSYFYFSKGESVGYCQYQRVGGVSFSTVHKPNKRIGSGYRVESFEEALLNRPYWASKNDIVHKYSSVCEFLKSHWEPLNKVCDESFKEVTA